MRLAVLGLALLVSAMLREGNGTWLDQAVLWLPSGIGVAGLWLLGLRAAWLVFAATVVQRGLIGYDLSVGLPAAAGSTAEALLGAFILQRFALRPSFDRLRDIGGVLCAAAVAPLGSILFSWFARMYVWTNPSMPVYSGWHGWWWMNALGVLVVVPVLATWSVPSGRPLAGRGRAREAWLTTATIVVGLVLMLRFGPAGAMGIAVLALAIPLSLYAALRFGPPGAAGTGSLTTVVVCVATLHGYGPFVTLGWGERLTTLQIFALALLTVPLLFGVLIAERDQARAKESRAEILRVSTLKALPDITYLIDENGTCLDVHIPPGMQTPYPASSIVGQDIRVFLPPEAAPAMEVIARDALANKIVSSFEYTIPVDGRVQTREARCFPYGERQMLAVVRDITERKFSESVREFEARILELVATGRPTSEIFAAIVDGIERLTGNGMCWIRLVEGAALGHATVGSLPAGFVASTASIPICEGSGSCGTAVHRNQAVFSENIELDPIWGRPKNLALRHGIRACWSVPVPGRHGEAVGVFAVFYPTPRAPVDAERRLVLRAGALAGIALERERSSEALRRSEGLLASINRSVNEGLCRSTPDLRVVYANAALARMFGFESTDVMVGEDITSYFEDPERVKELLARLRTEGQFLNEEARLRRRDGSLFWGLITAGTEFGPDGAALHFDGAVTDISARKDLEEKFRQAQKMEAVGQLAGGVAHDFNNLLTAISGYSEAIVDAVPPDSDIRHLAGEVVQAAQRAAGLTRQLLAFSRRQVLSPQVLDLEAVVAQLGGMLRRLIGEKLRLHLAEPAGGCWVRVDRTQLEQVIVNLVLNARDAMADGGDIRVETLTVDVDETFARAHPDLEPGPYTVLGVHDAGRGMEEDIRARAFDPFFTTKEPGKGTGLGLATVYGIVRQSGGAVWLDSDPGSGTTAWIYLPRVNATQHEAPPPRHPVSMVPREATVLLVEDEDIVRDLIERTLLHDGHQVLSAGDGREALEISRGHAQPIDLLITDVVMPHLSGSDLAGILRGERPGLPVLFISGYSTDADDVGNLAGAWGDFLQKPFTPGELRRRCAALLAPRIAE